MINLSPRQRRISLAALISPSLFWLIVFFLIPLLIVVAMSFGQRGTYGGIEWNLTLENYARLADPLYIKIFWRSFSIAGITTIICLLLGYPLAFWIATRSPNRRTLFIMLLIVPFWTNFLVRTYAWILILRDQGIINVAWTGPIHAVAMWLAANLPGTFSASLSSLTAEPLGLFGTNLAIIIGLVYGWLPDMVLPCYAAIERFDFSLSEAANDLYANRVRTFLRVVFPLTLPGILAGSMLVFIPSLGAYVTPDLLGGARSVMIGNVIYSQFMAARDYPFGAAVAMGLMIIMVIGTIIYFRAGAKSTDTVQPGETAR
jgi:spermidine/putrescine transport system permease protein